MKNIINIISNYVINFTFGEFMFFRLTISITSGTHAQAHPTKPVRGEEMGREKGAKVGGGTAGREG